MGQREGMGAIPFDGGVAFRVWAPNAEQVCVIGDFNDWDGGATVMESEGNGYWYAETSAQVGQEYKYQLTAGGQTFQRVDPYALSLIHI